MFYQISQDIWKQFKQGLLTRAKCKTISKYVPFSNPTKSYKTPAIDGPKNAPSANDDDQMPDNKP